MQNKRKKKIQPKITVRTFTITQDYYDTMYYGREYVPFIRLRGKWLKEIGFKSGQRIIVKVSEKCLVIMPLPPNQGNYA